MTQNVTMPDGSLHTFPDEATPDMITAALSGGGAPPQAADPNVQQIGVTGRFGQGVMDPVNGLAQAMVHGAEYVSPDGVFKGASNYMDTDLANQEQNYQARRAASGSTGMDLARLAGGITATAPVAAIMPGAAAEGTMARIGSGALQGATQGAMQPVTGGPGDYASQKGTQTALGAAVGGAVNPAVGLAGDVIAPKIAPNVQSLMNEGVTPTPGQILGGGWRGAEEKASSIPYLGDVIKVGQGRAVGDFNRAALNRALSPIDQSTDQIGRAGVEDVGDKLSAAYNNVLPNLSLKLNDGVASGVEDAGVNLPSSQQKAFADIMSKQFEKFGDTGMMNGEQLKGFESELGSQAKGYTGDASFDNQQLGAAIQKAQNAVRDNLAEQNPEFAPQLQAVNQGYANFARVRAAAAANKEDGVFTPNQLATAIRQQDKSAGKGQFAKGAALMQDLSDPGMQVLANKIPNSGTTDRAMQALLAATVLHGTVSPVSALATGAAALPYMSASAQKLAATLLTKRPDMAQPIGSAVQALAPYLTSGVVKNATQQ